MPRYQENKEKEKETRKNKAPNSSLFKQAIKSFSSRHTSSVHATRAKRAQPEPAHSSSPVPSVNRSHHLLTNTIHKAKAIQSKQSYLGTTHSIISTSQTLVRAVSIQSHSSSYPRLRLIGYAPEPSASVSIGRLSRPLASCVNAGDDSNGQHPLAKDGCQAPTN